MEPFHKESIWRVEVGVSWTSQISWRIQWKDFLITVAASVLYPTTVTVPPLHNNADQATQAQNQTT